MTDWWTKYVAKPKDYVVLTPERWSNCKVEYILGAGWLWTTEHLAKSTAIQIPHSLDNLSFH